VKVKSFTGQIHYHILNHITKALLRLFLTETTPRHPYAVSAMSYIVSISYGWGDRHIHWYDLDLNPKFS